jgi:hypothetical protein
MCGNFGLLFIKNPPIEGTDNEVSERTSKKGPNTTGFTPLDEEEQVVRTRTVSFSETVNPKPEQDTGRRVGFTTTEEAKDELRNPLLILEDQTANTEIRGGQAGGYSSLEYERVKNSAPVATHPIGETVHSPFRSTHSVSGDMHNVLAARVRTNPRLSQSQSHVQAAQRRQQASASEVAQSPMHTQEQGREHPYGRTRNHSHDATVHLYQRNRTMSQTANYSQFEAEYVAVPHNTRVRTVARKRYPLAADLSRQFLQERKGKGIALDNTFTGKMPCRCCTSVLLHSSE